VYYGKFLSRKRWLKLVREPGMAKVWVTQEKGSDVNLASHLLADGFHGRYSVAVVVSDDTDLLTPIRMVREDLKLVVGVINPQDHKPHEDMVSAATFVKQIRQGPLSASELPDVVIDKDGAEIAKPKPWY
jgi:hypothetical protein